MSDLRGLEPWTTPLRTRLVVAFAILLLAGAHLVKDRLQRAAARAEAAAIPLQTTLDDLRPAADTLVMFRDLQAQDLDQFKLTYSSTAVANKMLYESGLSLQEERRLLEKQLDILTTYLFVNPALQRIFLMRGDEVLSSDLISHIPPRYFGVITDSAPVSVPPLPESVRIVSKERFAHPERGQSEIIDGVLQWVPPQVGTSVRSRALGEFVVFTNSPLILHGPPLDAEAHEQFPHWCVGLSAEAARRIYRGSFIGTRILLHVRSSHGD